MIRCWLIVERYRIFDVWFNIHFHVHCTIRIYLHLNTTIHRYIHCRRNGMYCQLCYDRKSKIKYRTKQFERHTSYDTYLLIEFFLFETFFFPLCSTTKKHSRYRSLVVDFARVQTIRTRTIDKLLFVGSLSRVVELVWVLRIEIQKSTARWQVHCLSTIVERKRCFLISIAHSIRQLHWAHFSLVSTISSRRIIIIIVHW